MSIISAILSRNEHELSVTAKQKETITLTQFISAKKLRLRCFSIPQQKKKNVTHTNSTDLTGISCSHFPDLFYQLYFIGFAMVCYLRLQDLGIFHVILYAYGFPDAYPNNRQSNTWNKNCQREKQ